MAARVMHTRVGRLTSPMGGGATTGRSRRVGVRFLTPGQLVFWLSVCNTASKTPHQKHHAGGRADGEASGLENRHTVTIPGVRLLRPPLWRAI